MNRISSLTAFSFLSIVLSACTAEKLDGGSTGDTKAGADIADAPLSGTIAAQPFEAKSVDIYFNERAGQWLLSIDNYEGDCGSIKDRPPSDESMTVNVVGLDPAAGAIPIAPGVTRYATLQLGVYMASEGKEPDTRNAQSGTLVLDSWDETPGATIAGKLKLVADDESAVEGTFTAKVCPAR
jgi:hypothetical protein